MPRFFKVQSAMFKVQMWCRVRDDINNLDPGVKPQDDTLFFFLKTITK